nr:MAG TPA: hypothetical protein [Caudoviricetes sp.]DAS36465.1 MAG TPA: hypothetical protein [Caudoviricetes sp.]
MSNFLILIIYVDMRSEYNNEDEIRLTYPSLEKKNNKK